MTVSEPPQNFQTDKIAGLIRQAFHVIVQRFPVCAASDEFYFFPQVVDGRPDWSFWDDFSAGSVAEVADDLRSLETELTMLETASLPPDDRIDAELTISMLRTLREQLLEVAPHRTQPTFHLTVVAAGLAEALMADEPSAWRARTAGLPAFLTRGVRCLERVPRLFLRAGREMVADLLTWLDQLQRSGRETEEIRAALHAFDSALEGASGVDSFRMPEDQLARLVEEHMASAMTIEQATEELSLEFREMQEILACETARLTSDRDWRTAEQNLPFCAAPNSDLLQLYRPELARLESHCRQQGLVPNTLETSRNLQLKPVPSHLAAIRASDAYSAIPGHPPRGGVFYVMQEEGAAVSRQVGRSLEYRMTAVHEAWPGHHLLDMARWNLSRVSRRPIEHPMFYEGWACLGEELMARTGYLTDPWDRFLLARRRLTRAARGLVDLGLQTGTMNFPQAVEKLMQAGYRFETAQAVLPKYLLRPGYQLCYTIGLRQGLRLLETNQRGGIAFFVKQVLAHGEIGFGRLSKMLAENHPHGDFTEER